MTPVRSLVVAALLLVMLPVPLVALANGRVALVVGNSTYAHIGRLPNPQNDATDISAALRRLGFQVTTELDANRVELTEALRAFTRRSAGADISLVFYAGHGLEMDAVNYLVPVDARLELDVDVRFETVTLEDMLASTLGASLRMVILDACRNNPLARSMQRTLAGRSVSAGSFGNLDEALLGDETLVAYAAAAGTTAADGRGRNSPYTAALLTHLEHSLELGLLFRRVRAQVLASTNGQQRPHEYQSLVGEHYLAPPSAGTAEALQPAAALDAAAPAAADATENLFWQSIVNSTNPADFEDYLRQFPTGVFARLARNRLTAFGEETISSVAADPRPPASAPSVDRPPSPAPGSRFRDCPSCPELVAVPAGTFRMGCGKEEHDSCENNDDTVPIHEVRVASFALSSYEITRAEYAAFALATGHTPRGCRVISREWKTRRFRRDFWVWTGQSQNQSSWRAPGFEQGDDHPAVCVSWEDAAAYARWLSAETGVRYRLPTEAEWEYAARSGKRTGFGREWNSDQVKLLCVDGNVYDRTAVEPRANWDLRNSDCSDGAVWTAQVGSFRANAFGLYDMLGNASEWVEDCWHDDYAGAPQDGSQWTNGGQCRSRVYRGGSWYLSITIYWAERFPARPTHRTNEKGFRVARTLD